MGYSPHSECSAQAVTCLQRSKPKPQTPNEYNGYTGSQDRRPAAVSSAMSATKLCSTRLGRLLLHAVCLCRRPAAAGFYLKGLTRELREWRQQRVRR